MNKLALILALAVAACGGDDTSNRPPPRRPAAARKPAAAAKKKKKGKDDLEARIHVEDRVTCPVSAKPTGPSCDPDNPACDDGTYCIEVGNGHFCEACPERDSIRHVFRDRDFVSDQARDPFQSFVVIAPGGPGVPVSGPKREPTKNCQRTDQLIATGYSYQDLKLVGIVAKGTQRKVLMMAGNVGKIIKRGDCVGKEKALVKDIGTGYITFQIDADPDSKRPAEERSIQLYPNGLETQLPLDDGEAPPPAPVAPVVTPTTAPVVVPPK